MHITESEKSTEAVGVLSGFRITAPWNGQTEGEKEGGFDQERIEKRAGCQCEMPLKGFPDFVKRGM